MQEDLFETFFVKSSKVGLRSILQAADLTLTLTNLLLIRNYPQKVHVPHIGNVN